jgi:hypothetical protein
MADDLIFDTTNDLNTFYRTNEANELNRNTEFIEVYQCFVLIVIPQHLISECPKQ